jgi:hypothetical protein
LEGQGHCKLQPGTLVVVAAYRLGKERCFFGLARRLGTKVSAVHGEGLSFLFGLARWLKATGSAAHGEALLSFSFLSRVKAPCNAVELCSAVLDVSSAWVFTVQLRAAAGKT